MINHPRISELLLETGAYKDLEEPVIMTSGELGIYYINTEMLCQDDGKFNEFGDNSQAMIQHAVQMTREHPTFQEVIGILSEETVKLLQQSIPPKAISGGQRRDWIFSGPVAHQLNLPHFSLYKQEEGILDKVECILPKGEVIDYSLRSLVSKATRFTVVHVVDLITEGSSVYKTDKKKDGGWVPMLRSRGGNVTDLVAVVTRQQGGEEMLAEKGVQVHPFVAINKNFLRQHSSNPERALAYLQNPRQWNENYLRKHGALAFVETFNPEKGKLDRAIKFIERYSKVLEECGKLQELKEAISSRYELSLL